MRRFGSRSLLISCTFYKKMLAVVPAALFAKQGKAAETLYRIKQKDCVQKPLQKDLVFETIGKIKEELQIVEERQ
ncbi:hypothetical protein [Cesiribacter sp. SM1]|uniref:hypothetical protein n=1 Tax=Cesiribacter sp. SM1 TaxID=2861196 RepID=UPI001CD5A178|nr:hypothetical protein [Cesiribacter sp. SM1]